MLCMAMATSATAQEDDFLCDPSFEDCRTPILNMIKAETAGIDVSFWFMTDTKYSTEIIKRWQAGVPVRVLLDLRADGNYPVERERFGSPSSRPASRSDTRRPQASTTGR